MDYEKAYKEIIEKLRKLHNDWNSTQNRAAKEIELVLPELRESEDERIRKEIINFLELPHPQFVGKRDHEEWIAWLEKQGEQNNTDRKGDTDEIYQQEQDADWLMSIIPQPNQYDKGYEDGYSAAKYNQWKPTDKQMEDFRMLLDYNIGVFDYVKFKSVDSLYEDLKKI